MVKFRATGEFLIRLDALAARHGGNRSAAIKAAVMRASMEAGELPEVASRDEVLRLLGVRAREGHIGACKVLLEELRRDAAAPRGVSLRDELAAFDDELAARNGRVDAALPAEEAAGG
jgi:hypothetical protein